MTTATGIRHEPLPIHLRTRTWLIALAVLALVKIVGTGAYGWAVVSVPLIVLVALVLPIRAMRGIREEISCAGREVPRGR